MGSLGCPECGRTPVIYSVSQKMWFCKSCKHTWREEDGKPEPVYFVPEKLPVRKPSEVKKPASAARRRKTVRPAPTRTKSGPTKKKSKK